MKDVLAEEGRARSQGRDGEEGGIDREGGRRVGG